MQQEQSGPWRRGAKLPARVSCCFFLGAQGGVRIYTSQERGLGLFKHAGPCSWMLRSHVVLSPFPPGLWPVIALTPACRGHRTGTAAQVQLVSIKTEPFQSPQLRADPPNAWGTGLLCVCVCGDRRLLRGSRCLRRWGAAGGTYRSPRHLQGEKSPCPCAVPLPGGSRAESCLAHRTPALISGGFGALSSV